MSLYRVGYVQSDPKLFAVEANLKACLAMMDAAEAELWVLPELAASGYAFKTKQELAGVAEPADGPTARRLKDYAKKRGCAVVIGLPEKAGGRFYNSSLLVTATKTTVYRKVHLFDAEKKFFAPGDLGFPVADAGGVKVGMMVCFDWFFPEACRTLALAGAQIIAHPANLVMPWGPEAMRTRSLENRVYSVTADRVGTERGLKFIGCSQILGTKGQVMAQSSATAVEAKVVGILPKLALDKKLTAANDLFADRRPAAYAL